MKISFVVITLNEEDNLARCLKSCADLAAEIVILDSGSTDRTEEIAREFGARFEHQDWLGYVGQKNQAVSMAKNDWIFSLDADEALSDGLRNEIQEIIYDGAPQNINGFSMPRCVQYEERWIRNGDWYPDRVIRLFKKSVSKFAGGKVHERLEVEGGVEEFTHDIHHYSFKDREDHWTRCEKYARLWAESEHERGKKVGVISPYTHAIFRWFRGYILKMGFLDGWQGMRIAYYCAHEVKLKYQLLRQMNRRQREER
ncbi:MAG: glycosyl transferase [Verrucomicrobiales bacterium]|nr:glycosyl transferase [Verrucomicrobiales bacterium]|tara:strand:+ start:4854 stop:5621 length:768 start_codon:yes stop_codon:yes gene_type:complete